MMFDSRNRKSRTAISAGLAIAASMLALSGCAGPAASGGEDALEKKTIGVSFGQIQNPFFQAVRAGLEEKAKEYGYKLDFTDANSDGNQQVNQLQTLITKGVDALVYIPINTAAANTGVQAANAADIPIVGIDSAPEGGSAAELTSYVASDSVDAANTMCTWIAEKMGGQGELGIITGILGSTPELERSEGCAEALKEYPDIEVVSNQTADWDSAKAFTVAQNMMSANPNLKAIFAENDGMAQGAARATTTAPEHIILGSLDGFPTTWPYLRDGSIDATQTQQPYEMGLVAGDTIADILRGEEVEPLQYQETFTVTGENADQYEAELLFGPELKDLYSSKE